MGTVYAATNLALGSPVAIKIVPSIRLTSAEARARFHREAQAASRLKSEHVARVFDVGETGTDAFMVMELLEGSDLSQLLKRTGRLEPAEAVDYVLQACEAIAEAHALGIIHRDLKPHNLFLTTKLGGEPLVKVLDFGISKYVGSEGITSTVSVMGSPAYMAPEQMRSSKDVDERTDVWALGVVLYELLTAEMPWDADTVPEICARVMTQPPDAIQDLRPELSPALAATVMRCLEKDPARRFASVAQLASALEHHARGRGAGAAARARAILNEEPPRTERLTPSPVKERTQPIVHPLADTVALPTQPVAGYPRPQPPQPPRRSGMDGVGIAILLGGITLVLLALGFGLLAAIGAWSHANAVDAGPPSLKTIKLTPDGARASSSMEEHGPEHAVDGDPATHWAEAGPVIGGSGEWIELSWTSRVTVKRVRVKAAGAGFAPLKKVRVRFDGSAIDRTLDEGSGELLIDEISQSTRTVRVEVEDTFPPARRIALAEVEVEGARETR
jgi:serine/threonine-protein kinase